jgi:phosphohistidine phosphatase
MKQLHITRHGKSSWDHPDLADIDRPLNEHGVATAYLMAQRLSDRGVIPDLLISSPAVRALSTAVIFMRVMKLPSSCLQINEAIYTGNVDELVQIIRSVNDRYSNVMLFGHNPAFTILANRFLTRGIDNIPTAGIVSLTFPVEKWKEIDKTRPAEEIFDYPKRI